MAQQIPYEPLTGRECEILALLVQRLSDREIADRIFLALSTVRWYNRQIFGKLGVKNRKQAIQQAATLGVLETVATARPTPQHNLPAALTPFIGRSVELDELARMLVHPHTRLVTLLAPGGMGKTRLALETAERLQDEYADGCRFVELAGLSLREQFVSAVADAVGLRAMTDGRTPLQQQVADFLRRKHLLLVLDNFEHLLDVAPTVASWLAAAPHIKVLTTSREKLSLTAETVYSLTGLHYPSDDRDEPTRYAAVQLFVECALRANPRFEDYDTSGIGRICRVAQGMPLAIEMAAAWVSALSVAEIANEVSRSADFLHTKAQNAPERLRSVRAVFEAAWARLDEDTRRAFRWLSVFRGGCTREAAQTITGANVATLSALVDKALLWRDPHTERYEVHELLRQYAEEELEKSGEGEAARQAHLAYYGPLADEWAHAMQRGSELEAYAVLDADIDNIRQALARAVGRGIADEIGHFTELIWYYDRRGWWMEYVTTIKAAADSLEPHDSVALAECLIYLSLYDTSRLHLNRELAKARAERALDMLRRLGAREVLPMALMACVDSFSGPEMLEQIDRVIEEGFSIAEEYDDPRVMGALWLHYAITPEFLKNWPEATARVREAYRRYRQVGNTWGMCHALDLLGKYATELRDYGEAERHYQELIWLAQSIDYIVAHEWGLTGLMNIAYLQRDWLAAKRLNAESLGIRRRIGAPDHQVFEKLTVGVYIAVMLDEPDEARYHLRESMKVFSEQAKMYNDRWWLLIATGYIVLSGAAGRAAAYLGYLSQRGEYGGFEDARRQEDYSALVSKCRAALTPEEFDDAVARGRTLTPEAAIAEVSALL